MTTLKTSACPTCGGNHAPGAHHRPPAVSQRPPQLPSPEVSRRQPDPAGDDAEEQSSVRVRSSNGNEDEEEEPEEGVSNNQVGVRSGATPNNQPGAQPAAVPSPGVVVQPRVAPNNQPATSFPPPPPEGSPAATSLPRYGRAEGRQVREDGN